MSVVRTLFLMTLMATCAGCGGSDGNPASSTIGTSGGSSSCGGATNHGTMTAVINGTAWTATCVATASWPGNILSIGGSDLTQSIGIAATTTGIGTFDMTTGVANALVNLVPASAATWTANVGGGTGTVTLSQLSAAGARGTFSFTAVALSGTGATGSKVVTSGTFNVTF